MMTPTYANDGTYNAPDTEIEMFSEFAVLAATFVVRAFEFVERRECVRLCIDKPTGRIARPREPREHSNLDKTDLSVYYWPSNSLPDSVDRRVGVLNE
jgi:hypothetical protein